MHGGSSLGGLASPRFVHGWYSGYFPFAAFRVAALAHERQRRIIVAERRPRKDE